MKVTTQHEMIALFIIAIGALYLWTLPINDMPFGDVDSSAHFTSGDYMTQKDKSIYALPYYLVFAIGGGAEGKFAYPPQFNVGIGITQIIGGTRILSPYIFIAILCLLGILGIFLLVRSLYGILAGICAAFLMVFSRRDIMYYLFGVWPQAVAFTFVPIVIYAFYKFINSEEEKKQTLYFVMTILLVGLQYTFHQQAYFFSIAFMVIYSGVLLIAKRRLPFKIRHGVLLIVGLVVIVFLLAPFQFGLTFRSVLFSKATEAKAAGEFGFKPENLGRLFYWFKPTEGHYHSLPPNYYKYSYVYGGYWTLPLLLFGFVLLLIRRRPQDILVISWLITLYLFLHMEIIGGNRNFRFLQIEAQLFSTIMAFGLVSLGSIFKLPNKARDYLKYSLVAVFLIVGIIYNAKPIYSELANSYKGILRITPPEYKAAEWIKGNTEEDADFFLVGTVAYNKKKWLQGLSFRRFDYDTNLITQHFDGIAVPDYIFVDYSDLSALGRYDVIQQLEVWVKARLENATLVYDKENIKVYKRGNQSWGWE